MASNYNGRRAPNVTRYLRNLNGPAISPSEEEAYGIEQDLALFTNAQFFDFETGQNTNFQTQPSANKIDGEAAPVVTASPADLSVNDMSSLNIGDFNFDFNAYNAPSLPFGTDPLGMQQIQSVPLFPTHVSQPQQQANFIQPVAPQASGTKRKAELSLEERSRIAAEEDKRRRNTAASARFRVKKKQREQALEKSAKEMTQKVSELEHHIKQLETENKWLRNILLEKHDHDQVSAMLAEGYPEKAELDRITQDLAASAAAIANPAVDSE